MSKIIWEYDLSDFEDKLELDRSLKSLDLCLALHLMQEQLRSILKHGSKRYTDDEDITIEKVREDFNRILEEYNINLDDLLV